MRELGVCKQSRRLYEGSRNSAVPVSQFRPLLPIEFIGIAQQQGIAEYDGCKGVIFREESFDPITKIRRGHIYRLEGKQPETWHVQDPSRKDLVEASWANGTAQQLEAVSYQIDGLSYLRNLSKLPKVVLGEEPFHSFWKILAIETQFDGKPLVTLKALSSFGAVPTLIPEQVPKNVRGLLIRKLEDAEAAANRLGPIETIGACRAVLSLVMGALADNLELDLGAGINKRLAANKKANNDTGNGQDFITFCGNIVARLHSRGKPNEELKHGTRAISQEDANLALNCLWFVLVELGWAKAD